MKQQRVLILAIVVISIIILVLYFSYTAPSVERSEPDKFWVSDTMVAKIDLQGFEVQNHAWEGDSILILVLKRNNNSR